MAILGRCQEQAPAADASRRGALQGVVAPPAAPILSRRLRGPPCTRPPNISFFNEVSLSPLGRLSHIYYARTLQAFLGNFQGLGRSYPRYFYFWVFGILFSKLLLTRCVAVSEVIRLYKVVYWINYMILTFMILRKLLILIIFKIRSSIGNIPEPYWRGHKLTVTGWSGSQHFVAWARNGPKVWGPFRRLARYNNNNYYGR